ncbi:hypothetical protein [Ilumatobacter coccineus]|uniref:AttH domain-containing protein n=1 Tax=Ilumatobacter coccineus (strain NBRC 103263 / KCTC 29153 / YM16-304) TaxID=1313172 RepID=A0A6C7DWJ7_ILUCY|nr:hypothetical protein [Ilumatobacter coccineus]BAN00934.1 hypothetical protein YM304_06200 [Ilumatobacter coccineus YM16-304]
MTLSPHDELFVHQTPTTFGEVSSSDLGWDDGTYLGAYSADAGVFLFAGMRVAPNTDMIGGYVGVIHDGRQRTCRVSRPWRADMSTTIGPLRLDVIEPFEEIRLVLDANESGIEVDLTWVATRPAHLEPRHQARRRGRLTTDQSRYSQGGSPTGRITIDGHTHEVTPANWSADRDHSWGLYASRAPLAPSSRWLPPSEHDGKSRALRLWANFEVDGAAGMFHLHEAADGSRDGLNDTFSSPFEGAAWRDGEVAVRFTDAEHEIELVPGTRLVSGVTVRFTDTDDQTWVHRYEPAAVPWTPATIGYGRGSWSDGGSMFTYREGVASEWDELQVDPQPFELVLADGRSIPNSIGLEYVCRLWVTGPDGTEHGPGLAHLECFLDGPYEPLGLT